MTFLYPSFLWALGAVAVPIIIHLFNFRRYKKVYFTNVRFLRELQQESKSRSRLKEILILICRCLALICLVLAFAQPVLPDESGISTDANSPVSIYIDNSFSMENLGSQGPLLEVARARARDLVKHFGSTHRYQILTNDFEGRHQRLYGQDEVLSAIDEVKSSAAPRRLSEVVRRQTEFLRSAGDHKPLMFILSDAQRSTFDLEKINPDTSSRITLIPLNANKTANVYIDSCWFDSPIQQKGFIQKLHARLVNSGPEPVEAGSAKLFLNGSQAAISSFSIAANSETEALFTFECRKDGFNRGYLKIEDFPMVFDDQLHFAFNAAINIRVAVINGSNIPPSNNITSLFAGDSLFTLRRFNEQGIDYSLVRSSDLLVLNQLSELSSGLLSELITFSKQGGAVVIIPSASLNVASFNPALSALSLPALQPGDTNKVSAAAIAAETGFYTGVFEKVDDRMNLPQVLFHYPIKSSSMRNADALLTLQNGNVLLTRARLNNAEFYLFASPLEVQATNFGKHALFVPTMYRIAFSSLKVSPLFYPLNTNVVIRVKDSLLRSEHPPHIVHGEGNAEVIPEARVIENNLYVYTRQQVTLPGYYELRRNKRPLLPLAFNHSRLESDLNAFTAEELQRILDDKGWKNVTMIQGAEAGLQAGFTDGIEGKKVWKLFILLTLLFIVTEIVLLRLLK